MYELFLQAPYASTQTSTGTVTALPYASAAKDAAQGASALGSGASGSSDAKEQQQGKSNFSLQPVTAGNEEGVNLMSQWCQVKPWAGEAALCTAAR